MPGEEGPAYSLSGVPFPRQTLLLGRTSQDTKDHLPVAKGKWYGLDEVSGPRALQRAVIKSWEKRTSEHQEEVPLQFASLSENPTTVC